MKKKDIEELKTKSADELRKLLKEKRDEFRNLRFDLYAGKVKNVVLLREVKKTIARILTLVRMEKHEK